MKTLATLLISSLAVLLLAGCADSNATYTNQTLNFRKVQVKMPDGQIITGELKSYTPSSRGSLINVSLKDGRAFYSDSVNIMLYND